MISHQSAGPLRAKRDGLEVFPLDTEETEFGSHPKTKSSIVVRFTEHYASRRTCFGKMLKSCAHKS